MSSKTSELKIIISGDGKQLDASLRQSDKQIDAWANHAKQKVDQANTGIAASFKRLGGKVDAKVMGLASNPLALIGGVAGILMAGQQIIKYDAALTQSAINGRLSAEEQMKLAKEIESVALATGNSRESVLGGMDAIIQRTGKVQFARDVITELGIAATATGASVADMGAFASQLDQKLGISATNLHEAFNLIVAQGKSGAFTLGDMAAMGERLFSVAGRLNMNGMSDLRSFGAFIQVAREATGSAESATTSVERSLSSIIDKQTQIKELGFDIFKSPGNLKSFEEIIKGTIIATKGNEKLLGDLFGEQGIRAVSPLAQEWRKTGKFEHFDSFKTADFGRQDELMADYARMSGTAAKNFERLAEATRRFADAALSPGIASLSSKLGALADNKEQLESIMTVFRGVGGLLSGVAAGVLKVVEGWGLLFQLYEQGAEVVANATMGVAYDKKNAPLFDFLKTIPIVDVVTRIPGLVGDLFAAPSAQVPRLLDPASAGTGASIPMQSPTGGPAIVVPPITNKNDISISVNIDKDNNASSSVDGSGNRVRVSVDRGDQSPLGPKR